jgi:hypothetical protein
MHAHGIPGTLYACVELIFLVTKLSPSASSLIHSLSIARKEGQWFLSYSQEGHKMYHSNQNILKQKGGTISSCIRTMRINQHYLRDWHTCSSYLLETKPFLELLRVWKRNPFPEHITSHRGFHEQRRRWTSCCVDNKLYLPQSQPSVHVW